MEIEILKTGMYRDGGTISIETNVGQFCIDARIRSKTKGIMYSGYPDKSEKTDPDLSVKIFKAVFHRLKNS